MIAPKSGDGFALDQTNFVRSRFRFDGQSCILAVPEDLPEYRQEKLN